MINKYFSRVDLSSPPGLAVLKTPGFFSLYLARLQSMEKVSQISKTPQHLARAKAPNVVHDCRVTNSRPTALCGPYHGNIGSGICSKNLLDTRLMWSVCKRSNIIITTISYSQQWRNMGTWESSREKQVIFILGTNSLQMAVPFSTRSTSSYQLKNMRLSWRRQQGHV